jgi:hypothetical protein
MAKKSQAQLAAAFAKQSTPAPAPKPTPKPSPGPAPKASTTTKAQSSIFPGTKTPAPNTVGPLKSGYVPISKPAPKLYSGPMIDPKTGKSTIKAATPKKPAAKIISNPKPPVKPPVVKPPPAVKTPTVDVPTSSPTITNDIFATPPATNEDPVITPPPVKSAPIDTVIFIDEAFSSELITDLLFEDVGGQELLTIARNDTVNGQSVIYQPFKNLGILQEIYNPTSLLKLQETSDKFFSNFTINLRDRIPKVGSGLNGANYYLDLASGEGVIEFINLRSDEQVEVQIASAGIIEDVGI